MKSESITWPQLGVILAAIGGVWAVAALMFGLKSEIQLLKHDMHQVKVALKIPDDQKEAATTGYLENADGPAEAVAVPEGGWHAAYLADHCKHCPECCPKVAAEAWP